MAKFCLVEDVAKKFKKLLKDGTINPQELNGMTSKQRREFFGKFMSENQAKNTNTLFERKLLQKNKVKGMIAWAKEVTGIKPEVRRDLVSKIERMVEDTKGNVLDPTSEKAFLEDLASSKLGVDVTFEEAQEITRLSKEITAAKEAAGDFTDFSSRINYGEKIIDMNTYISTLKPPPNLPDQIANVLNVPRAIMATADLSAPGRQGWGMVTRKQYWENLLPMVKAALKEKNFKQIQADIITRPNFRSMKRAGLRLTSLGDDLLNREDDFMTNLLDNVGIVRASERGYTGFLSKLRADMYDDFLRKAQLAGEDVSVGSQVTKDLAEVVNNFTGAGKLGRIDRSVPLLNSLFFSPRKIVATIQMFNPQKYLDPRISPTARIEALKSLFGMMSVSSAIVTAGYMLGADAELNPTSADFGKVKFGNTRIDVTGGNATYATLWARIFSNKTKSTITGLEKELGSDFGQRSRGDIVVKYFRNKLSPTASFVGDWLYGTDAIGQPFDVSTFEGLGTKNAALKRLMPIIISSTIETAMEGDTTGAIVSAMADFFGFGGQNYDASEDWNNKTTNEMIELKESVGQKKFDKLNQEFNEKWIATINQTQAEPDYIALSEEEKAKELSKRKRKLKKSIIGEFKTKAEKPQSADTFLDVLEPSAQTADEIFGQVFEGKPSELKSDDLIQLFQ